MSGFGIQEACQPAERPLFLFPVFVAESATRQSLAEADKPILTPAAPDGLEGNERLALSMWRKSASSTLRKTCISCLFALIGTMQSQGLQTSETRVSRDHRRYRYRRGGHFQRALEVWRRLTIFLCCAMPFSTNGWHLRRQRSPAKLRLAAALRATAPSSAQHGYCIYKLDSGRITVRVPTDQQNHRPRHAGQTH